MPEEEMAGARLSEYTPDSIREVAEVLSQQPVNYVNDITNRIGQAQQSIGPLAANTMGSTTAGLGNYTYNRLVRPQVDAMRDQILVQGYTNALNKMLSDSLRDAKNAYNNRNNNGGGGGGGNNLPDVGDVPIEDEVVEGGQQPKLYLTGSEAYNITVGNYDHKLSKSELEQISGRPMTQHNYEVYEALYDGNSEKAADMTKGGE